MKEYQFEYTKMWDTLIVVLLVIVTFSLTEILGMYIKLNIFLSIVPSFGMAYLLFKFLKKKVVRVCNAKLQANSVTFEFKTQIKVIDFNELTSYKFYEGNNGPILYLNGSTESFKIFANNNFCKTDDFKIFSDATIIQLDKYKENNNLMLIHEGSVYATKGFLIFLFILTFIYLLSFLINNKGIRLSVGIIGGYCLFMLWMLYLNKRNLKSK